MRKQITDTRKKALVVAIKNIKDFEDAEIASLVGVSRQTLDKWLKKGTYDTNN